MQRSFPFALLGAVALLAAPALGQSTAVHRTTIQEQAFPAPLHTITVRIVTDPKGEVAPHNHPGVEMGYIAGGTAEVTLAGAPAKILKAGDSFAVPPSVVHRVRNVGAGPLTIVSTYVVDPSKPLVTPAAP
jgi:quercetin dioxygenase-like cupin family protein